MGRSERFSRSGASEAPTRRRPSRVRGPAATSGCPGASVRRKRDQGDAIVVFRITGDLAFKHIIPALQRMVQADELKVPVVGVCALEP